MPHAWAADLATTGLVLLLIDSLVPLTDHAARITLGGWWPWAVTVAGFLVLRLAVAGLYAVMGFLVGRMLPPSPARGR
ncbi:MAG TPA: hypothetical protein VNX21_02025 [Candidatus Thermoplasmatota archaeon]|nr:hypothetical protein [Candidatus Thermoplasmatota archaeon]